MPPYIGDDDDDSLTESDTELNAAENDYGDEVEAVSEYLERKRSPPLEPAEEEDESPKSERPPPPKKLRTPAKTAKRSAPAPARSKIPAPERVLVLEEPVSVAPAPLKKQKAPQKPAAEISEPQKSNPEPKKRKIAVRTLKRVAPDRYCRNCGVETAGAKPIQPRRKKPEPPCRK